MACNCPSNSCLLPRRPLAGQLRNYLFWTFAVCCMVVIVNVNVVIVVDNDLCCLVGAV
jgi:hypothetical protein